MANYYPTISREPVVPRFLQEPVDPRSRLWDTPRYVPYDLPRGSNRPRPVPDIGVRPPPSVPAPPIQDWPGPLPDVHGPPIYPDPIQNPNRYQPFEPYPDGKTFPGLPSSIARGALPTLARLMAPEALAPWVTRLNGLYAALWLAWQLYQALRPGPAVIARPAGTMAGEWTLGWECPTHPGGSFIFDKSLVINDPRQDDAMCLLRYMPSELTIESLDRTYWTGTTPDLASDGYVSQKWWRENPHPSEVPFVLPDVSTDTRPYGQPTPWDLPEVAQALPLLGPRLGVAPSSPPFSSISRLNRMAQENARTGTFPWVMREVSPVVQQLPSTLVQSDILSAPSSAWRPFTIAEPWLPPQVAVQPITDILPQLDPMAEPGPWLGQDIVLPPGDTRNRTRGRRRPRRYRLRRWYGRRPRRVKEKKLKMPWQLVRLFVRATRHGAFIRDIWKSLPPECRKPPKKARKPRTKFPHDRAERPLKRHRGTDYNPFPSSRYGPGARSNPLTSGRSYIGKGGVRRYV